MYHLTHKPFEPEDTTIPQADVNYQKCFEGASYPPDGLCRICDLENAVRLLMVDGPASPLVKDYVTSLMGDGDSWYSMIRDLRDRARLHLASVKAGRYMDDPNPEVKDD